MRFLSYNKNLKSFSRQLRNNSTFGEIILWQYLQILRLVVEVDGQYHDWDETYVKDEERTKILEEKDLQFLRFTEHEIKYDIQNVLRAIENYIFDYEEKFPEIIQKKERRKKLF